MAPTKTAERGGSAAFVNPVIFWTSNGRYRTRTCGLIHVKETTKPAYGLIGREKPRLWPFPAEQQEAWATMLDWQRGAFEREIEKTKPCWARWVREHPEVGDEGLQEMLAGPGVDDLAAVESGGVG
ncbi:MAG: hypothetical protein WD009_04975 [Phycisphaeraceae bacterium]